MNSTIFRIAFIALVTGVLIFIVAEKATKIGRKLDRLERPSLATSKVRTAQR